MIYNDHYTILATIQKLTQRSNVLPVHLKPVISIIQMAAVVDSLGLCKQRQYTTGLIEECQQSRTTLLTYTHDTAIIKTHIALKHCDIIISMQTGNKPSGLVAARRTLSCSSQDDSEYARSLRSDYGQHVKQVSRYAVGRNETVQDSDMV